MNQRIQNLQNKVLNENKPFACQDGVLCNLFEGVDAKDQLRILKEEYPKFIVIDDNSFIAGMYPGCAFWERDIDHGERNWSAAMPDKYNAYIDTLFMSGGNHMSADFGYVVTHGIISLMEQIEEKKAHVTDTKQKEFLEELYFTTEAIVTWAGAYGVALREAAERTDSEERRNRLLQMASICERVPYQPSESFYEAIQSYYFMFILFPDGLGRLDQYLYPYYQADIEKGILTRQQALELIEELFIKIFAWLGREVSWSGNNHGVVAGYTAEGECGHNECTSLILEAVTELSIWRPQISYRVTAKTTMEQMQEAVDANCKRPDLIMFLNDDVLVNSMIHVGVAYEDAVNYSSSGCNETILTGCSQMGALEGHVNVMYTLERMMKDTEALESLQNFDEFYRLFEKYLAEDLDIIFRQSVDRDTIAARDLRLITSLFTDGCISSATAVTRGGARYNYCTWCLTGIINLADSLSIIRQMVFEENRFRLTELSRFLEADWKGYEKQHAYILNNGRYFGNDDDYADMLVNKVSASVNEVAANYTPYRGGCYLFGTLTGYELSHVVFGCNSGASPDGRHAKDPFAASIAAYPGADKNGMTAYLKSVAKIDSKLLQSSIVVNLKMDRALADGPEKRARLTALFMTYFKLGGVHLQINYLSADELIRAQQEPEKYRNLRVRVTGFSGFFTTFDKKLQEELIQRSLHTN